MARRGPQESSHREGRPGVMPAVHACSVCPPGPVPFCSFRNPCPPTLSAHGPGRTDPAQFLTHTYSAHDHRDQLRILAHSPLGTAFRTFTAATGLETLSFSWKATGLKLSLVPLATTWGKPA